MNTDDLAKKIKVAKRIEELRRRVMRETNRGTLSRDTVYRALNRPDLSTDLLEIIRSTAMDMICN